jgi:hypothetical protein
VFAFAFAAGGSWIYDDHLLIPNNQYVHSLSWWPRWFLTDFWDIGDEFAKLGGRIAYWRPAITTTYALDWKLSGGQPLLFHLTNLAWQGAVGALSFVVLRRWLGKAVWPAGVAALLFVVHPTKAESVAWIAGRTDVICMAAILVATQGVAWRLAGRRGGVLLEAAGTLLAYASKEQAIVLPAFVMVEAWVAADRPALDLRVVKRMLVAAAPQIAIVIAYMVLRKLLLPIQPINIESAGLPRGDHVLVVIETMGRFADLTFTPHALSIQHGLVRVAGGKQLHDPFYIALGVIVVVALLGAAWAARRRLPAVSVGIVLFFVTVAPTSNIVNTQMKTLVSERFLYLPLFGLALAAGAIVARWPRRFVYALSALAIALLSIQSVRRSIDYGDEDRFWERELALHPDSAEARRRKVSRLIAAKRYDAALRETLELLRSSALPEDLPAAADIAQLTSDLAPDHDRASLQAIDAFCADMIARKAPAAELHLPRLTFTIPTQTRRYAMYLEAYALKLLALRMSIRSRLGDDAGALALAKDGLERCPTCPSTVTGAALALARAGQYDDATRVIESGRGHVTDAALDSLAEMIGKSRTEWDRAAADPPGTPAQLQAHATALSALELWGRAYDVLAPFEDQIKSAPKFALGFAELAVRAGEAAVARDVLAPTHTPVEIERLIHDWSRTMGWVDE